VSCVAWCHNVYIFGCMISIAYIMYIYVIRLLARTCMTLFLPSVTEMDGKQISKSLSNEQHNIDDIDYLMSVIYHRVLFLWICIWGAGYRQIVKIRETQIYIKKHKKPKQIHWVWGVSCINWEVLTLPLFLGRGCKNITE